MPTPAEVDELDQEVSGLTILATAALVDQFGDAIDPDPVESARSVRELVDAVTTEYAIAGAGSAVDFYSSVRPPASPSFTPAVSLPADLISGPTYGWMTNPLIPDLDQIQADLTLGLEEALKRSVDAMEKAMRDAINEVIGQATEEDTLNGVRYARFPGSASPCAYCVLRASRGAIFYSEETATSGDHVRCRCKVTPVFPGEDVPYQRKPYFAQYEAGLDAQYEADVSAIRADKSLVGPARRKALRSALLAGMRRGNGIR